MIPGSGGTQRLARLVGLGRAKDIVMRGRRVGPRRRSRSGSSRRSCPRRSSTRAVDGLCDELSPPLAAVALAMAKRVLNTAYDGPLHVGLELEGLAYGLLQQTARLPRGRRGVRREAASRSSRDASAGGELPLPGEAGGENGLVVRGDELQVPDGEPGPADQVDPAQERRQRQPHLVLIGILGRQVDA